MSTSSQGGSLAKISVAPATGQGLQVPAQGSGESLQESSGKPVRRSRSSKTPRCYQAVDSTSSSAILPRWGTMRAGEWLERVTPVPLIGVTECGSWPTPQRIDSNFSASKPETARARHARGAQRMVSTIVAAEDGGPLNPEFSEWLMGWPIGWSALQPLATDKFRRWYLSFSGT